MLLAADFWAQSLRGGYSTSDPHAINGDVILAAQMLTSGEPASVVITVNTKHLSRFVPCSYWESFTP